MFENYEIKRIQLLPMSDREDDNGFEDEEEVRDFLDRELAENDGIYGYNERGIDLGTVCKLTIIFLQDVV